MQESFSKFVEPTSRWRKRWLLGTQGRDFVPQGGSHAFKSITALAAIMQYSFSPCSLLSKLSDLGMYLIAAVSAVWNRLFRDFKWLLYFCRGVLGC